MIKRICSKNVSEENCSSSKSWNERNESLKNPSVIQYILELPAIGIYNILFQNYYISFLKFLMSFYIG